MDCLLDTHAFLWFINADALLSDKAKKFIEESSAIKYVSIASIWEIAIKLNIGKLVLDFPFEELRQHLFINNFKLLPITFDDSAILTSLPLHHKDPFDRVLIAQAINNNLFVISKDPFLQLYKIPLIW